MRAGGTPRGRIRGSLRMIGWRWSITSLWCSTTNYSVASFSTPTFKWPSAIRGGIIDRPCGAVNQAQGHCCYVFLLCIVVKFIQRKAPLTLIPVSPSLQCTVCIWKWQPNKAAVRETMLTTKRRVAKCLVDCWWESAAGTGGDSDDYCGLEYLDASSQIDLACVEDGALRSQLELCLNNSPILLFILYSPVRVYKYLLCLKYIYIWSPYFFIWLQVFQSFLNTLGISLQHLSSRLSTNYFTTPSISNIMSLVNKENCWK